MILPVRSTRSVGSVLTAFSWPSTPTGRVHHRRGCRTRFHRDHRRTTLDPARHRPGPERTEQPGVGRQIRRRARPDRTCRWRRLWKVHRRQKRLVLLFCIRHRTSVPSSTWLSTMAREKGCMGIESPSLPLVVGIIGATGTGKTELSLGIARRFRRIDHLCRLDASLPGHGRRDGETQSVSERAGVPHALIDVVPPDHHFSVAEYQVLALEAVNVRRFARSDCRSSSGGTGLYVRAVLDGYEFLPEKPERESAERAANAARKRAPRASESNRPSRGT